MIRALASLLLAFGLAIAPGAAAWTSCANELPRAPLVVTFHPRSDTPFTIDQLRAALRAGAHGVELDLRWRAKDSAVVCAHDARDVGQSPTLTDALDAILAVQGRSPSVQKDGLQFYVTLDLKESGPAYHRAILEALRERAAHWSNSVRPGDGPRGITVIVSGMAAPLERAAASGGGLDGLCVVEGRSLLRVLDLSDRDGPLGWVALQHPVTRERIRALHEGRDAQYRGRYNVRVYGAGRRHSDAIAAGTDAVNADLDEIARVRAQGAARPKAATDATTTATDWILQDWRVNSSERVRFEAAWRARSKARRARVKGWRGEVLLRSLDDPVVYRVVERWDGRESWKRSSRAGAYALGAAGGKPVPGSRMELTEVQDRLGTAPIAGDHVRFYRIRTRRGTARSFHRAWRRANDAIRGAYPAGLGSSLLRDPGQADALVEIVRWKSEAAWRRFIDAAPPDADADAAIRAAIGDIVTERYVAIGIAR